MKKTTVIVPEELSDGIQACQVELTGLKDLISYLLANTEYNIPEERIEALERRFMAQTKLYNDLKLKVEDYIPSDFDKTKTSWNLDFATYTVEIIED